MGANANNIQPPSSLNPSYYQLMSLSKTMMQDQSIKSIRIPSINQSNDQSAQRIDAVRIFMWLQYWTMDVNLGSGEWFHVHSFLLVFTHIIERRKDFTVIPATMSLYHNYDLVYELYCSW